MYDNCDYCRDMRPKIWQRIENEKAPENVLPVQDKKAFFHLVWEKKWEEARKNHWKAKPVAATAEAK